MLQVETLHQHHLEKTQQQPQTHRHMTPLETGHMINHMTPPSHMIRLKISHVTSLRRVHREISLRMIVVRSIPFNSLLQRGVKYTWTWIGQDIIMILRLQLHTCILYQNSCARLEENRKKLLIDTDISTWTFVIIIL